MYPTGVQRVHAGRSRPQAVRRSRPEDEACGTSYEAVRDEGGLRGTGPAIRCWSILPSPSAAVSMSVDPSRAKCSRG